MLNAPLNKGAKLLQNEERSHGVEFGGDAPPNVFVPPKFYCAQKHLFYYYLYIYLTTILLQAVA